jgi:aryl-alcohol dehydrogenase-like predicted oxidoreductase
MGVVPYFPLASGLLTGKYKKEEQFPAESRLALMPNFAGVASDENFDLVDALTRFAHDRGHTLLELAVGWLATQDGVASVITGATTPEQVRANAAAGAWRLSADDMLSVPAAP